MNVHILVGNIATIKPIDVIVNSANKTLKRGGGVCASIHNKAGKTVEDECTKKYPEGINIGEAVVTTAENLYAKYLIHTVPAKYHLDDNLEQSLKDCYHNSLILADNLKCKSIAFPSIGVGISRYPKDMASKIAIETINSFDAKYLTDVVIILSKEHDKIYFSQNL